jgi:uncharacterized glyoxalase superfamily protein PhnB
MDESTQVFYPTFRYRDARTAIDWLADRWGRHAGEGWVYVAVEDPDALHERAKAAGAEIVMAPMDTDYGSRDFALRDLEGNLWSFGTYRP